MKYGVLAVGGKAGVVDLFAGWNIAPAESILLEEPLMAEREKFASSASLSLSWRAL